MMETMAANDGGQESARYGKRDHQQQAGVRCGKYFQMPLHYPRYSREDYEAMPEWQLDRLLSEYGLPATGTIQQKRNFAMGAFLWGAGGNH
ncbi:hypothetical protein BAE44_0017280 [Dichanthelium oligosanthes]|uniref:DUF7722 domain-containing protein n=1 Tax=Dichanthelium oligosanthes TaxID=888268 RepID=A0A1E5V977_9POAL|nr:hypothetical protein BAE44_0017280 [Dichanthelium oligosanthes]